MHYADEQPAMADLKLRVARDLIDRVLDNGASSQSDTP